MGNTKLATATPAVIRSVIWSIGTTFAILGLIEIIMFARDALPYFVISGIFMVIWAVLEVVRYFSKRDKV